MTGIEFLYEVYNLNNQARHSIEQKIKRKINFNTASGDNYGLIIPLHFPLGTGEDQHRKVPVGPLRYGS